MIMLGQKTERILCDKCKSLVLPKGRISFVTKKGKKLEFCSENCKKVFLNEKD